MHTRQFPSALDNRVIIVSSASRSTEEELRPFSCRLDQRLHLSSDISNTICKYCLFANQKSRDAPDMNGSGRTGLSIHRARSANSLVPLLPPPIQRISERATI